MRYASIRKFDISNGEGIGVVLFTQGCPFHCKGCFNTETWSYEGGFLYTKEQKNIIIKLLNNDYISRFTVLGGEPFLPQNKQDLEELLKTIKQTYPTKKVWAYSGNLFEKLVIDYSNLLQYIDVLVDGPYVEAKRDLTLAFRGSSNQRIIDVPASLKARKAVIKKTTWAERKNNNLYIKKDNEWIKPEHIYVKEEI